MAQSLSRMISLACSVGTVALWAPLAAAQSTTNDPAKVSNADASSDAAAAVGRGPAPTTAAAPAVAQDDNLLGDIVVTAQRREERVQDIPAAISAIGAEDLVTAGVVNTRDLQLVTPSLAFTQASYAPQPSIRGIGTRGVNPGDEQVVPVYLDGVYQPFVVGGLFELSDVERVEVLRGPQGTLLGRNATGGAINIITQTPRSGFSGRATAGYGRFNEREAAVYVAGGSDRVTASFNAQYLADDGYVRDIANNNRRLARIDSLLLRGKLVMKAGDRTTITVAANYTDRYDDTSLANFALNGNSIARQGRPTLLYATGNRQSSQDPGFAPRLTTKQNAVSATIVHNFDGFDVTSISGYSANYLSYDADADMTPAVVIKLAVDQFDRSFSQELFAASTGTGSFQWVAGLFYFNNNAGQNPRNLNGGRIYTDTNIDAYAAYAQGTLDITSKLHVTAGGRYSYDKKSASAYNVPSTLTLPLQEKSWDSFNPSASIDYEVTDRTRFYARYATAFKSGVFNATGFARDPVNPEQVESYEVGLKSDPLPWLRVNLAGFYTDYRDIQIFARSPDPTNASVVLQNAATAKIYGIEGDLLIRPVRGLSLRASGSLMSAKYDEFRNAQSFVARAGGGNTAIIIDASGNQLTRVPEFTGNVGGDYSFDALGGSLTIGGNVYVSGPFPWGVDDRLIQGSYALVNAQTVWTSPDDRYTVTVWGRNLSNSKPLLTVSSSVLGDQAAYYRPITYGVRVGFKF